MRKKKWSLELAEQMHAAGYSLGHISRYMGVSKPCIYFALHPERKGIYEPNDERREMIREYQRGYYAQNKKRLLAVNARRRSAAKEMRA